MTISIHSKTILLSVLVLLATLVCNGISTPLPIWQKPLLPHVWNTPHELAFMASYQNSPVTFGVGTTYTFSMTATHSIATTDNGIQCFVKLSQHTDPFPTQVTVNGDNLDIQWTPMVSVEENHVMVQCLNVIFVPPESQPERDDMDGTLQSSRTTYHITGTLFAPQTNESFHHLVAENLHISHTFAWESPPLKDPVQSQGQAVATSTASPASTMDVDTDEWDRSLQSLTQDPTGPTTTSTMTTAEYQQDLTYPNRYGIRVEFTFQKGESGAIAKLNHPLLSVASLYTSNAQTDRLYSHHHFYHLLDARGEPVSSLQCVDNPSHQLQFDPTSSTITMPATVDRCVVRMVYHPHSLYYHIIQANQDKHDENDPNIDLLSFIVTGTIEHESSPVVQISETYRVPKVIKDGSFSPSQLFAWVSPLPNAHHMLPVPHDITFFIAPTATTLDDMEFTIHLLAHVFEANTTFQDTADANVPQDLLGPIGELVSQAQVTCGDHSTMMKSRWNPSTSDTGTEDDPDGDTDVNITHFTSTSTIDLTKIPSFHTQPFGVTCTLRLPPKALPDVRAVLFMISYDVPLQGSLALADRPTTITTTTTTNGIGTRKWADHTLDKPSHTLQTVPIVMYNTHHLSSWFESSALLEPFRTDRYYDGGYTIPFPLVEKKDEQQAPADSNTPLTESSSPLLTLPVIKPQFTYTYIEARLDFTLSIYHNSHFPAQKSAPTSQDDPKPGNHDDNDDDLALQIFFLDKGMSVATMINQSETHKYSIHPIVSAGQDNQEPIRYPTTVTPLNSIFPVNTDENNNNNDDDDNATEVITSNTILPSIVVPIHGDFDQQHPLLLTLQVHVDPSYNAYRNVKMVAIIVPRYLAHYGHYAGQLYGLNTRVQNYIPPDPRIRTKSYQFKCTSWDNLRELYVPKKYYEAVDDTYFIPCSTYDFITDPDSKAEWRRSSYWEYTSPPSEFHFQHVSWTPQCYYVQPVVCIETTTIGENSSMVTMPPERCITNGVDHLHHKIPCGIVSEQRAFAPYPACRNGDEDICKDVQLTDLTINIHDGFADLAWKYQGSDPWHRGIITMKLSETTVIIQTNILVSSQKATISLPSFHITSSITLPITLRIANTSFSTSTQARILFSHVTNSCPYPVNDQNYLCQCPYGHHSNQIDSQIFDLYEDGTNLKCTPLCHNDAYWHTNWQTGIGSCSCEQRYLDGYCMVLDPTFDDSSKCKIVFPDNINTPYIITETCEYGIPTGTECSTCQCFHGWDLDANGRCSHCILDDPEVCVVENTDPITYTEDYCPYDTCICKPGYAGKRCEIKVIYGAMTFTRKAGYNEDKNGRISNRSAESPFIVPRGEIQNIEMQLIEEIKSSLPFPSHVLIAQITQYYPDSNGSNRLLNNTVVYALAPALPNPIIPQGAHHTPQLANKVSFLSETGGGDDNGDMDSHLPYLRLSALWDEMKLRREKMSIGDPYYGDLVSISRIFDPHCADSSLPDGKSCPDGIFHLIGARAQADRKSKPVRPPYVPIDYGDSDNRMIYILIACAVGIPLVLAAIIIPILCICRKRKIGWFKPSYQHSPTNHHHHHQHQHEQERNRSSWGEGNQVNVDHEADHHHDDLQMARW